MPNPFQQARFIQSAYQPKDFVPDNGMEVAFAGRSNSGKSSAINTISGQRQLARISKTPGRTQLINFFEIDESHRFVDLPGYGYYRVRPVCRVRHAGEHSNQALYYDLESRFLSNFPDRRSR